MECVREIKEEHDDQVGSRSVKLVVETTTADQVPDITQCVNWFDNTTRTALKTSEFVSSHHFVVGGVRLKVVVRNTRLEQPEPNADDQFCAQVLAAAKECMDEVQRLLTATAPASPAVATAATSPRLDINNDQFCAQVLAVTAPASPALDNNNNNYNNNNNNVSGARRHSGPVRRFATPPDTNRVLTRRRQKELNAFHSVQTRTRTKKQ